MTFETFIFQDLVGNDATATSGGWATLQCGNQSISTTNFAWILPNENTIFHSTAWTLSSNNVGYLASDSSYSSSGDGSTLSTSLEAIYSIDTVNGSLTMNNVDNSVFGQYSCLTSSGVARMTLTEEVIPPFQYTQIQVLHAAWGCFLSVVVLLYIPMFIKYGYLYPKQMASGVGATQPNTESGGSKPNFL